MYKNVLVTGGVVSSLLLTGAATTFAQTSSQNGSGMMSGMHRAIPAQRMTDMMTKLGVNADDVRQELSDGKNLPDILREHNITSDQIKQAMGDKKPNFGKRRGMMMLQMAPELLQAQANVLSMTTDELQTALKNKQTMRSIVASKGMTMDQFHQKINDQINQMIADGKIAGKQAQFYQRMMNHDMGEMGRQEIR